jgi:hypothetical protein
MSQNTAIFTGDANLERAAYYLKMRYGYNNKLRSIKCHVIAAMPGFQKISDNVVGISLSGERSTVANNME